MNEPIVGLCFVLRTVCNNDNGISFSREHVVRLLSKQPGFVKELFQDEQKHSNSIVSYFYSLKKYHATFYSKLITSLITLLIT